MNVTSKILLKDGLIIDGSGKKGYKGNVLIEDDVIAAVSDKPIAVDDCEIIDCSGLAVSPGFIDAHSHYDQLVDLNDEVDYTLPFIKQGVTTYAAGQCGYSACGMTFDYPTGQMLPNATEQGIGPWETYAEYFDYMKKYGMRQNMCMLAGHATALGSIVSLTPKGDTNERDMKRVSDIMIEGMDAGCKGISLGLGYPPCKFVSDDEIRKICDLAIERGKLITVHSRVYNSAAPYLYGDDYSVPHNIRWHQEFFDRFRDSGAHMIVSHLAFLGKTAWPSYEPFMEMFNGYVDNGGFDLWFDLFPFAMGATNVGLLLVPFFYDHMDTIYDNKDQMNELDAIMRARFENIGYPLNMMMLCNAYCSDYRPYQGKYITDILKETGLSVAELYTDLYRKSNGGATIYTLFDYPEYMLPEVMKHPHALYGTDAWFEAGSHQNANAYGAFPKYLRLARETEGNTLENGVAHMTGIVADQYDIEKRGYLREGYFADITVFNPDIKEAATVEHSDRFSDDVKHVFINGSHIINNGVFDETSRTGRIV